MSVKERLRDLLALHLGVDRDSISDETMFYDDLGADSLDAVEIAMAIETEFDIEVSDDVFEEWGELGFKDAAAGLDTLVNSRDVPDHASGATSVPSN